MVMPPSDLAKAPPVPEGAPTLAKGEARSLKHLNPQQVALLAALATDFGASKTWTADFGTYAPAQATMVQMAQGTAAVFAESTNAGNWDTYVNALRLLCGASLAAQLETLVAGYRLALKQNPGLANTYPALAAYANARAATTARIVASRKANKKAEAKAGASTAAPASTASAAPTAAGGAHS